MAAQAEVSYSDGSSISFRYKLPAIARYLKGSLGVNYKQMKKTPLFPWLLKMSTGDAIKAAAGREIARIKVTEKVL